MSRIVLPLLFLLMYALHQDYWYWRETRPLVFGFLPIGLAYHGLYTLGAVGLMALLCKYAWPGHLDQEDHRS